MVSPDKRCSSRAGPFQNIHDENTEAILWVLFSVLSILITAGMRYLVLGYVLRTIPPDPPAPKPCPRCEYVDEALRHIPHPPSSKPKPTAKELLAEDKRRMAAVPSISRFVICTNLGFLNIITLVALAFAIQSMMYCGNELAAGTPIADRQQLLATVCMWIVYAISAAWASSGILCWAMWVRNLWGGPEAAERWPIKSWLGMAVLFGAAMAPFLLVMILVMIIGMALRACVCGKPLIQTQAVEMESGIGFGSGIEREEEEEEEEEEDADIK
jgi:hypothetical protein